MPGMLLARLDDDRELPVAFVDVPDALQERGVQGDGNARALQETGGHVLVAAQAETQRGAARQGKAHDANEGRDAHLVERAVHNVVVLVEDDVGLQTHQPPLEGGDVVGQWHRGDRVPQGAQGSGHAADHQLQVPVASAVGAGL